MKEQELLNIQVREHEDKSRQTTGTNSLETTEFQVRLF